MNDRGSQYENHDDIGEMMIFLTVLQKTISIWIGDEINHSSIDKLIIMR